MKAYHIYPEDDLEEHILHCQYPAKGGVTCACKCNPVWQEELGAVFIIHNSFDGREAVEWANKILGDKKAFQ
jgi:hypothetical protein